MWKQTNLGYLRVDRLGCRLRRLASEGEPSLLDSVLDSTPRENTSARDHVIIHTQVRSRAVGFLDELFSTQYFFFLSMLIYNIARVRMRNCTSTRLNWHSITRPGAFATRASGRVASGALSARSQLALGFRDARKVALLVPPWCFRPARQRTPERGREEEENEGANAKQFGLVEGRKLRSDERSQLPFEFHAGPLVIDCVDVLVLQVTKSLELHRVVERCGGDRTVLSSGNAERGVRTDLVHFCEGRQRIRKGRLHSRLRE